jgi:hypothetical protein
LKELLRELSPPPNPSPALPHPTEKKHERSLFILTGALHETIVKPSKHIPSSVFARERL